MKCKDKQVHTCRKGTSLSTTSTRYFCPFLLTLANSELCCVWTQAIRANCIIYRLQIGPAVTVSPEGSQKQIQLQRSF